MRRVEKDIKSKATLCMLYIAVTRVCNSAAIVVPNDFIASEDLPHVQIWLDANSSSDVPRGLLD